VQVLTAEYAQSKQAAKKFEDRMNRYIKKEDNARKSIAEIAGTLQKLNQYNAVLVAENERLKLEDRLRMDAMVGRETGVN
jgi:septal ring factor EnvC (AmiA/AmiB activator)